MSNVPEMKELTFTPNVTVQFVDAEVQSVVIDWAQSYSGMDQDADEWLTLEFDNWLRDHGVVGGQMQLFAEEDE